MKLLKFGQVGGDMKSFIGNVHRGAIAIDPRLELVSGCFSRHQEKNNECGQTFNIDPDRLFTDWRELLSDELARHEDRIDVVIVCTPNNTHYEISKAFLEAGINVVCEKPLCFEVEEAEELARIAKEKDLVFAVTYAYTGYNMMKIMRQMVRKGDIGEILSVSAEYVQDWMLDEVCNNRPVNDQIWRTDPKYTGIGNCIGDIGTHMENAVRYITGMNIKRLMATVDRFGKTLDYNDNIIVEYDNGIHGSYWCSQLTAGRINGLKVSIFGTEGSLEWEQQNQDYAKYTPRGEATRIISKGAKYLDVPATWNARVPAGHPEGYYMAFANIYKNVATTIIKKKNGEIPTEDDLDFPTVDDGIDGVKFIHAVLKSGDNNSEWVEM